MTDSTPHGADKTPLFSAVVNCYNSEKYLEETIASVVSQTHQHWELIIWDNQSTDRTAEIVKSFKDERIRYFLSPEFTPLGEARRRGSEEARGEWIAYLDSDDLWLPNKLEQQAAIILAEKNAPDLGIVYGRTATIDDVGREKIFVQHLGDEPLPEGKVLDRLLLDRNFIPWVSALVRRSAFIEVGGIPDDLTFATDYWIFAAVAAKYRVRAVQEVCCKYRIHAESISSKMKPEMWAECARIVETFGGALAPHDVARRVREFRTLEAIAMARNGSPIAGLGKLIGEGSLPFFYKTWRLSRNVRN